jgi:hypothetical protein
MHTAMTFEGSQLRSEWILANPGAKEEKFEPWVLDGAAGTREQMNSYNMLRLPPEDVPSKEGDLAWCV